MCLSTDLQHLVWLNVSQHWPTTPGMTQRVPALTLQHLVWLNVSQHWPTPGMTQCVPALTYNTWYDSTCPITDPTTPGMTQRVPTLTYNTWYDSMCPSTDLQHLVWLNMSHHWPTTPGMTQCVPALTYNTWYDSMCSSTDPTHLVWLSVPSLTLQHLVWLNVSQHWPTTPGMTQRVPSLTLQHLAHGWVATRLPTVKTLVWLYQGKHSLVPGFPALEADTLPYHHQSNYLVSISVSAQDGIIALSKAHMRSAPSLCSLPKVALETAPIFVWLNIDRSWPWRVECWLLPFSTNWMLCKINIPTDPNICHLSVCGY